MNIRIILISCIIPRYMFSGTQDVSIQSTLVYADVTDEAIGNQIKGLWN
jgi:hypothetical protein